MRDLFPGFYNRTEEELSKLWQEGIFVFDTNMLLNVYRYTQKTRDRYFEILNILKKLNQLWIPYQAAYEYQDRRTDVIRGQLEPYTKVGNILQTTWQTLDSALEPYKSKHGFIDTTELAEQLISVIKNAKDTVTQSSDKYKQYKQENEALKKQDKLLEKLENLFQGNIGSPYSNSRLEELYKQAQLRIELRIPPGWEDEGKNSFKSYGDIVLWFQLIDYARTQKQPIIFVTDDGKKDWWVRDAKGKPIKPLPALVQEMLVEAGVLLHMYQGYEFLEQAAQFLKLEEEPDVIADAMAVTEQNTVEFSRSKLNRSFNPYKTRDEWIKYITSKLREAIEGEASLDFYAEDAEGHRQIRILRNQDTIYSLNINKDGLGRSDDGISFSYAIGRMISTSGINAWGHFKWDAEKELVVLELHDMSLLSSFNSGDAKGYTKEGFLEALWDKIRSVIENSLR